MPNSPLENFEKYIFSLLTFERKGDIIITEIERKLCMDYIILSAKIKIKPLKIKRRKIRK